jgi:hypothetical protein
VAAFYADENFPLPVVEALRRLGHDVLTAFEAGQGNERIPDDAVVEFAALSGRAVLTLDRWEFHRAPRAVGFHGGGSVGQVGGLEVDHGPLAGFAVGEVDLAGGQGALTHRDREGELAVDEVGRLGGRDFGDGAGSLEPGGRSS